MKIVITCVLLCEYLACFAAAKELWELSIEQLVESFGYPFEVYEDIPTEDGYLLTVHRIPHGKANNVTTKRIPVLVMHAMFGTSRLFLAFGPERGLGYFLADKGYDVWLGNFRGSSYSRKHLKLDSELHAKYWDFSWHEMGVYDIPAIIGFIKNVTGAERINYVGYSVGATSFYAFASHRPHFNKDINVGISLAPQAYMEHFPAAPYKHLAALEPLYRPLLKLINLVELPPKPLLQLMHSMIPNICNPRKSSLQLCTIIFTMIGVYSPPQVNKNDIIVSVSNFSSISANIVVHYSQNINSGKFRPMSFGRRKNLQIYGALEPPSYNISAITSPHALYYSKTDSVIHVKDVQRLCQELPKCIRKYAVPLISFKHSDFVFAKDVIRLVYEDVYNTLEKYN